MANRLSTANLISRGAAFAHALTARLPVHPLSPFRRRRIGVTRALKPASLLLVAAVLIVFIAVDAASSPVQAQSADASLSSLSLSDSLGDDIELSPEFSAATTSYTTDDDELASSVTSTTVTVETTDEDATAVIMINGVEDADGTVDLVPGYNDITVVVTAEDGTTTETYTVTVLRAAPEDTSTPTDDTITSLLSRLDVGVYELVNNGYHTQAAGYRPPTASNPMGTLSPAGFNYPAGFGPWYTIVALLLNQEGRPPGEFIPGILEMDVRGTVTSVASRGPPGDRHAALPVARFAGGCRHQALPRGR